VTVAYTLGDDAIEMIVEDQGVGLGSDADTAPRNPGESGMGMSIIRTVVDDLEVLQGADGRGTLLRMTKRLASDDA
jgi:anti-sigma regulatory factor (Ser/Thr protein kinase)